MKEDNRKLSMDSKELSINQEQGSLFDKVLSKVHSKKYGKHKSHKKLIISYKKGEVNNDEYNIDNKLLQLSDEKRKMKYSLVEEAVEDISNFHLKEKKGSEKRLTDLFNEEHLQKEEDFHVLPYKDSHNELYQTIINKYDKGDQDEINQLKDYGLNNIGSICFEENNPRITESLKKLKSRVNKKENISNTSFVNPLKKKSFTKENKKYLFNAIDILEKTQENKNVVTNLPEKKSPWCFLSNFRCGKCD